MADFQADSEDVCDEDTNQEAYPTFFLSVVFQNCKNMVDFHVLTKIVSILGPIVLEAK